MKSAALRAPGSPKAKVATAAAGAVQSRSSPATGPSPTGTQSAIASTRFCAKSAGSEPSPPRKTWKGADAAASASATWTPASDSRVRIIRASLSGSFPPFGIITAHEFMIASTLQNLHESTKHVVSKPSHPGLQDGCLLPKSVCCSPPRPPPITPSLSWKPP